MKIGMKTRDNARVTDDRCQFAFVIATFELPSSRGAPRKISGQSLSGGRPSYPPPIPHPSITAGGLHQLSSSVETGASSATVPAGIMGRITLFPFQACEEHCECCEFQWRITHFFVIRRIMKRKAAEFTYNFSGKFKAVGFGEQWPCAAGHESTNGTLRNGWEKERESCWDESCTTGVVREREVFECSS
jgi:hypothetical protein